MNSIHIWTQFHINVTKNYPQLSILSEYEWALNHDMRAFNHKTICKHWNNFLKQFYFFYNKTSIFSLFIINLWISNCFLEKLKGKQHFWFNFFWACSAISHFNYTVSTVFSTMQPWVFILLCKVWVLKNTKSGIKYARSIILGWALCNWEFFAVKIRIRSGCLLITIKLFVHICCLHFY